MAIWLPAVAIAVALRFSSGDATPPAPGTPSPSAAETAFERRAGVAEWQRSIAELGRERCAKRLAVVPTGPDSPAASGALVWWHDGERERIAYLPGAGEDPTVVAPLLVDGLLRGTAVLLNSHGDAALLQRIPELIPSYALPEGWQVLLPPLPATEGQAEGNR